MFQEMTLAFSVLCTVNSLYVVSAFGGGGGCRGVVRTCYLPDSLALFVSVKQCTHDLQRMV